MSDKPNDMLRQMMEWEGDVAGFEIRRRVEDGRSFSAEALNGLREEISNFIGSRIIRRWDATGEPPTRLVVEMVVTVS